MPEKFYSESGPNIEKEKIDFILNRAKEIGPEIVADYISFHENPELGGEEFETARKVKETLDGLGVEIIAEGLGGAGVIARIKGRGNEKAVALRADMDALSIKENSKNEPCSKKEGIMHACGHDAHTAGLLGAAKILQEMSQKEMLENDVILIFQSNEEGNDVRQRDGAVAAIEFLEKGGLRNQIKAFFGLHVYPELERGWINMADGVMTAKTATIELKLSSKGGHSKDAMILPNIDQVLSELKTKIRKEFGPNWKIALVDSQAEEIEGKAAVNVILSEAKRTWMLRIMSPDYRDITNNIMGRVKALVKECVEEDEGQAQGYAEDVGIVLSDDKKIKTDGPYLYHGYRPVIHRDPKLVSVAEECAKKAIHNCERTNSPLRIGENFSYYLEKFKGKQIDGVFMLVGAANQEKGIEKSEWHSPDFRIDPHVTKDLAAIYSIFAIKA